MDGEGRGGGEGVGEGGRGMRETTGGHRSLSVLLLHGLQSHTNLKKIISF